MSVTMHTYLKCVRFRDIDSTSCDHDCRQELLCKLKSARSEDPHACDSMPRESFEFHCFNIA
jgi:hypothetical protein